MKLLFVLISILSLVGCETNPTITEERSVYKTILVTPPDELLQDCSVEPPPDKEIYRKSEWTDKEKLLVDTYENALKNAILCNVSKKSLRDWKKKQQEIYPSK